MGNNIGSWLEPGCKYYKLPTLSQKHKIIHPELPCEVNGHALARLVGRCVYFRKNVDHALCGVPFDGTVFQGEQGMIAANADIVTRVKPGAALADDDIAGKNEFAAITFDAEALGVTVAPVFRSSLTFFMCHDRRGVKG